MMMKNKLILLMILSVIGISSFGQKFNKNARNQILLSGYIPDSCLVNLSDGLELSYYSNFDGNSFYKPRRIKATLVKNKFSIVIPDVTSVGYLIIPNLKIRSFNNNIFLIQAGDSLHLKATSKYEMHFSGKGAEKMNYQLWVGKQIYYDGFNGFQTINDVQNIYYAEKQTAEFTSSCLEGMNKILGTIDEKTFSLLRANVIYGIKLIWHLNMTNFINSNNNLYIKALRGVISNTFQEQRSAAITNDFLIKNSFPYIFYLSELNKTYTTLFKNSPLNNFEPGYQLINKNFKGLLKDKLLVQYFQEKSKDPNAIKYLSKTIPTILDKESKTILEQRSNASMPGKKAFNFQLETIEGKKVTLKDFKGKILLIDSWYKGCPNCLVLTRQLVPVIEHFKNNKDIVFIGLNVDKEKSRFIEGVKSGLYSSKEAVNVYTNGLGHEHPMLAFYQYNSYPNLLLIDKNGFIISANPPRPSNENKKNELIRLIEDNF